MPGKQFSALWRSCEAYRPVWIDRVVSGATESAINIHKLGWGSMGVVININ